MNKITLMFNERNCSGCHACEVACKQEHGLGVGPRVVRVIERAPFFKPLYCHHCDDAPCMIACWEDAITIDPDTGVVLHHPDKCNGCMWRAKPELKSRIRLRAWWNVRPTTMSRDM